MELPLPKGLNSMERAHLGRENLENCPLAGQGMSVSSKDNELTAPPFPVPLPREKG